jgi:hypothetical protein
VEIRSRVEPKIDPLLPIPYAVGIHIRLQNVRLSSDITEELEI